MRTPASEPRGRPMKCAALLMAGVSSDLQIGRYSGQLWRQEGV